MARKIFQTKYIISGNVVERYSFEKDQFKGFEPRNKKGKNRNGLFKEKNRCDVIRRARGTVMRSINANPCLNKFLTLTFKDNVTDLDYANSEFKKFIKRVNYQVLKTKKSKLKYVAVIEFQERGAIHYHMICDLPYIDVNELQQIWGLGFIKLNKIKGNKEKFGSSECDNVGAYVCKYMTKENTDDRLRGRKMYLMSRNLDKPTEILVGNEEIDLVAQAYGFSDPLESLAIKKSIISYMFYNEYCGTVIYHQYNLKRMRNRKIMQNKELHNISI